MKRGLKHLQHGSGTKRGSLPITVIIPEGSELHSYCYDKFGTKRSEDEIRKLLTEAPEHIKEIAISKGFWFLKNIKRYEQLLTQVENDDYYKIDLTNRVNCYQCRSCSHITKTIDVDPGVTPFSHECEKCGDLTYSTFYNDVAPDKEPTQEWYRPTYNEFKKLDAATKEHVLKGGLLDRKINNSTVLSSHFEDVK